jgi:hypothetical protein
MTTGPKGSDLRIALILFAGAVMEMAVNDEPQYAQKRGWADRFSSEITRELTSFRNQRDLGRPDKGICPGIPLVTQPLAT